MPETLQNAPVFVFLDDLETFLHDQNADVFLELLTEFQNQDFTVVATCRMGPEYRKVKQVIRQNQLSINDLFEEVAIKRENRTDLNPIFKTQNLKLDKRNFDGNIGSLFLPLEKMQRRYENLVQDGYGEEEVAVSILEAIKVHYYFLNYEGSKNTFDKDKIFEYVRRKHEIDEDDYDFEDLFDDAVNEVLRQTKTNLNFLEKESWMLLMDEAYSERVVKPEIQRNRDGKDELDRLWRKSVHKYYPSREEKREACFAFDLTSLSEKLKNLDFENALKKYRAFQKNMGTDGNEFTYSILIRKAGRKKFKKALELVEEMKTNGIRPNVITFTSLLEKVPNKDKAQEIIQKMKKAGVSPNHFTKTVYRKVTGENLEG